MSAPTWTVVWSAGNESGLTEGAAIRLETVLRREFGIETHRHIDLPDQKPKPEDLTVDEALVAQVREAVADGVARPVRNQAGRGNEA